ncbi:AB hydrolase superfamily protein YdjP [Coccomyxa sp. Obi]|nr:AB hydrolase superfamily protein YdjP [Coccomyxa sp. Obi]
MNSERKTGTQYITANDSVKIAFERMGRSGPVVVLLHGWSGSRHYYDRNAQAIAKYCQVYALDYRFHGDSDRPSWGYHVARLAADLHDFLEALALDEVTVVGSSMGAAVIWSYIELFGHQHLAKAVFVDQAPLQNVAPDWRMGSNGCYDAATLAALQTRLALDFESVADGVQAECLSRPLGHGMEEALKAETLRADPDALGRLMADHTQLDWRPLLPRIKIPCLNLVGRISKTFPWQGTAVVGQMIPNCHTVYFEQGNHFLYIEEPEKFNQLVIEFVEKGLAAVCSTISI